MKAKTKAQRIKERREELQIAQVDLANKIGITKQLLYKYENEIITNIPSNVIEKIAVELKCPPTYIMGWTSDVTLFNIVGLDDLEGTTFARCTTKDKAERAVEMLKTEGFDDLIEIRQDKIPVDTVEIDGKLIAL